MNFKKYIHLERLGTQEVEGIELGKCYVFPKIDGTNGSCWLGDDGQVHAGSRNRDLALGADNHGFRQSVTQNANISLFLKDFPHLRLFGEWLVPHSLKTYRDDCWKKFYVFDVEFESKGECGFLSYDYYQILLDTYGIEYIPPMGIITNGSYEDFVSYLPKNNYLVKDGSGAGEGIVIKRYDFINQYGRTVWAKLVTSEFKEKHIKEMGASETEKSLIEQAIAKKYCTQALVDKEYAKIAVEGWSPKQIPQLLNTVYYSVVKEEGWNFVKEHKNPSIDFKRLMHFTFAEVKSKKPELF